MLAGTHIIKTLLSASQRSTPTLRRGEMSYCSIDLALRLADGTERTSLRSSKSPTHHVCGFAAFIYFLVRSPINPKILLVKRIVALAGDIVTTLPPYPDKEVTIPPGHVWVEGRSKYSLCLLKICFTICCLQAMNLFTQRTVTFLDL